MEWRTGVSFLVLSCVALPGRLVLTAAPALAAGAPAQVTFEQATQNLTSGDAGTRLRAAQMLKESAYPEAAIPLAAAVSDPQDEVQLEAIAAELNIFLAEKIVTRKRVGFVIERRNQILAEPIFAAGPLVLGSRPVPLEVLTALRAAARDNNPGVRFEALYAFGALGGEPRGSVRRELLNTSGPDLAAMVGAPDPATRVSALRVMARVFQRRPGDGPIEPTVGDAVVTALNDKNRVVRGVAMQTLGAMRYERSIEALDGLFTFYGKGEMAEAAFDAIARIAHPASAVRLTTQLSSKNAALKSIAIEGLTRIGDAASLPAIDSALAGERNDFVLLAGRFCAVMLTGGPIDPITEALLKPKLRDMARQYLMELAPGRATLLVRHVQDPDSRIRLEVINALGLSLDPQALPIVQPTMTDPDPEVASAGERAVARLQAAVR